MDNFTLYSPTYFAFGKDRENDCGELVERFGGSKVLIHYGGDSVVRSGLLDRVKASLSNKGISFVELGGVMPNPRSGLVYQGIDLCKKDGDCYEPCTWICRCPAVGCAHCCRNEECDNQRKRLYCEGTEVRHEHSGGGKYCNLVCVTGE